MTMPLASTSSTANPMRNRHRVSSHDLNQSMSVLSIHGFQEDLLERQWHDVHRRRRKCPRLLDDRGCVRAGQDREHAPAAARADDAGRTEGDVGSVAGKYELDAAVPVAEVVERSRDDGPAAIEHGDVVGDLI